MKNESGSETKESSEALVDEVAEKVTAASFTPFVQQKHWWWIGVVCLLIAAALAFASVSTNILRDSIVSVALIFNLIYDHSNLSFTSFSISCIGGYLVYRSFWPFTW